jgi:hypothetical protein
MRFQTSTSNPAHTMTIDGTCDVSRFQANYLSNCDKQFRRQATFKIVNAKIFNTFDNMKTISFILAYASVVASKLVFNEDGTFKILHISDVHYEIPTISKSTCQDISQSQLPCDQSNSTAFLSWLIETEKPNLIVHTGDVIDWGTVPASTGMSEYYGISHKYGIPWAGSLGNHDDDSWTMPNREKVMNYVINLPGSLSLMGPVESSYGNFVLEIFSSANETTPVFRTYHFDADTQDSSISSDQVKWFQDTSKSMNQVADTPSLAFYHIPLEEYQIAISSGLPFSGHYNEGICYQPTNTGVFDALKDNGVKAGFCGHDHTNDFCVNYQDVYLCYEGSPGFQVTIDLYTNSIIIPLPISSTLLRPTERKDIREKLASQNCGPSEKKLFPGSV